jgi:alpha-L-rhamnosidase
MRRRIGTRAALAIGLLAATAAFAGSDSFSVSGLRCEYAKNPLGVDAPHPRLSWVLASGERGQRQSAYQILVASTQSKADAGQGDLWDSGKVASSQSTQVPYQGNALRSRQQCFWKVRSWDRQGRASAYSETARWEMGLLSKSDWQAEWIGYTAGWSGRALYFRKDFELEKPIRQARAYVAGLGYYELHLNGRRVGDHVLDPSFTDYAKRVEYVTYDVTEFLARGGNAVGVIAGNGWYGAPKVLVQLEVTYADGSTAEIYTHPMNFDPDWRIGVGPIVGNTVYDGEIYDARLEKDGWDRAGGDRTPPPDRTEGWVTAVAAEPPAGRLVAQSVEPIKIIETIRAKSVSEPKPGIFVFDTGQNIAGWAALRVRGERGTQVKLKFSEVLADDGTVNQENLRKAAATDIYTLRGGGTGGEDEQWEPRFTYHGFRYIQVEGYPGRPTLDSVLPKVVRTSVQPNGLVETSSELINRIQKMVWWTEASNMHSVPTDCPQRDERMGWMNDLTVRAEEAIYNFDVSRFFSKFVNDVADAQADDGTITDTAPRRWGRRPADPVSTSYLLLSWLPYQHYGDLRTIEEHYSGFAAWVHYLEGRTKNGIVPYGSWGDWSPPAEFGNPVGSPVSRDTPLPLMSTGYLYYDSRLLADMARALNRKDDEAKYTALAERTSAAFNREFWREDVGGYGANNQAANAFALELGLVPKDRVSRVVENLVKDVRAHGTHLTTGNLCTKYVLEMLAEHGHAELAYALAAQTTYPSWGFMLSKGATTVWERWELMTGGAMNSHNHPMLGSVSAWFYKYLAGIRSDPAGPGFQRFFVRPYAVKDLNWVKAEYTSMYGVIRGAWRRDADGFKLNVTVPVNSVATVFVPASDARRVTESGVPLEKAEGVKWLRNENGSVVLEVGSGNYEFVVR